jgi:hypothetical protein
VVKATGSADDTRRVQLDPLAVTVGLAFVAVVALGVWYRFVERKRLIQDLPTSKVRGVSLGLNELVGTAVSDRAEVSPHGAHECVWWKATYYTQSGDRDSWKKTDERTGGPVFFEVEDETGRMVVWPRHAELRGKQTYDGPYHAVSQAGVSLMERHLAGEGGTSRKVVEEVVPLGSPVYVLGTARLPEDRLRPEMGADPDGQNPFIVQVGTEADALWIERVAVAASFAVATGAAGWAGWLRGEGWGASAAVFAVLVVMGALSFVFSYNNLVMLAQRAEAAWGLIDIQLRRRHDLIPSLVAAVKAHRDHERQVQEMLAELRATSAMELAAAPSDAAVRMANVGLMKEASAVSQLLAVVESHPAMTADRSFRRLQEELVDTEDRIALARGFYNNSVGAYRDRARIFPGAIIAGFLPFQPSARFTGGDDAPAVRTADQVRNATASDLVAALNSATARYQRT